MTTDTPATNEKALADLREVTKLQCSKGNWNCNSYMHGLANGLIMALSIVEGTEPKFLSKPEDGWLDDRPDFTPTQCAASEVFSDAAVALTRAMSIQQSD